MKQEQKAAIYCIMDNFKEASGLAALFQANGIRTALVRGTPEKELPGGFDAVVLALRMRDIPPSEAVRKGRRALRWLQIPPQALVCIGCGSSVELLRRGNIVPLVDAVLAEVNREQAVFLPSIPEKNRQKRGVFFSQEAVEPGRLASDYIVELEALAREQGQQEMLRLEASSLRELSSAELRQKIAGFAAGHVRFYVLPDCRDEDCLHKVIGLFDQQHSVFVGNRAELRDWAARYGSLEKDMPFNPHTAGRGIVLAGSCALTVLQQTEAFRLMRGAAACYQLEPMKLMSRQQTIEDAWQWVERTEGDVLISSAEPPECVQKNHRIGQERMFGLLEKNISALARRAVEHGFTRIVIAGSETIDAVLAELGYRRFEAVSRAAADVPVLMPLAAPQLRLVMKCGSQGGVDFFWRALRQTKPGNRA